MSGSPGTRTVVLHGVPIAYTLRRSRRRTLGFIVGAAGLDVRAPRWASDAAIAAGMESKARWIVSKFVQQQERERRVRAAAVRWGDGARVAYRGRTVVVRLDASRLGGDGEAVLDDGVEPARLVIGLPPDASASAVRDAVQRWLQAEALRIIAERAAVFARRLNVRVTQIALSSAKTRWGSASADGTIRLHWRLVQLDPEMLDNVVAHELTHLREMNHGPRFWRLLAEVVDDPRGARKRLNAEAALLPAF